MIAQMIRNFAKNIRTMSNVELNCKWHFAPQMGGREDGPNDPMQDNFKKSPYASLIRESIQNSLDVPLNESKPVRMEFSISRIRAIDYSNFFQLKKHVEGCIKHFNNNNDAQTIYQPIIDYFNSLSKYDNLNYIKVADYNTRGMQYIKGDTSNPFYAFVRAAGVSAKKDSTAGGSFGFGKAAYFYISPIRTIIVSTQTEDGEHFFEGVSSLCTHELEHEDGLFVSVGYYDNNNGEPITDVENIPSRFRREEIGTDIYILGIDATDRAVIYNEMIEAVLRNFWLAIFEKKLEVRIGDTDINNENLQELMSQYFDSEHDTVRRERNYIPTPYLDAVANAGSDNRHIMFEDYLPNLGHVRFYALKSKKATDKVLYMRKPLMLVKARRTQSYNGFYGVFVCDDDTGNAYLRETENPAHDEWKSSNWRVNGKIQERGRLAIEAVDQYIITVRERMFANRQSEVQTIQGLEEFLYIPTAVEDDEDFSNESLVGDIIEQKDEEGNSPSTNLSDCVETPTKNEPSTGKVMIESTQTSNQPNSQGASLGGHGTRKKKTRGGGGVGTGKVDTRFAKGEEGVDGTFLTEVPVTYRSFAQSENGRIVHNIVIHSDYDFDNGRIDLIVGGDQADDVVTISSCSMPGKIRENTISGLHIVKGKNTLKIMFADNMKHAVKLDAYELK